MLTIGLDAGALTKERSKQFGTYTVTLELIKALMSVDAENRYRLYALEDVPLDLPENFSVQVIRPGTGFMHRIGLQELLKPSDVFLALNQSLPTVHRNIIGFSHGLSFLEFPDLYPDSAGKMRQQVQHMVDKANRIVVSSAAVKKRFNDIYKTGDRVVTVPFGIPTDLLHEEKRFKKKQFILYTGMNHPIKNLPLLFDSFRTLLQNNRFSRLKLLLVGAGSLLAELPDDLKNRVIVVPHSANRSELQQYYAEAQCLVSTSRYESFNLPVLEALSQGTPAVCVKSAAIPELTRYVTVVDAHAERIAEAITNTIMKPKPVPVTQLQKKFGWVTYAREIIKLYET